MYDNLEKGYAVQPFFCLLSSILLQKHCEKTASLFAATHLAALGYRHCSWVVPVPG